MLSSTGTTLPLYPKTHSKRRCGRVQTKMSGSGGGRAKLFPASDTVCHHETGTTGDHLGSADPEGEAQGPRGLKTTFLQALRFQKTGDQTVDCDGRHIQTGRPSWQGVQEEIFPRARGR
jgi:hypothetical protein